MQKEARAVLVKESSLLTELNRFHTSKKDIRGFQSKLSLYNKETDDHVYEQY